jgi:hypothetical protein
MFSLSPSTNYCNQAFVALLTGNGHMFVGLGSGSLKPTNKESRRPTRDSKRLSRPQ